MARDTKIAMGRRHRKSPVLGCKIHIQCQIGNTRLLDAGDEFYGVASGHRRHLGWLGKSSES